jgi:hypothetical protein
MPPPPAAAAGAASASASAIRWSVREKASRAGESGRSGVVGAGGGGGLTVDGRERELALGLSGLWPRLPTPAPRPVGGLYRRARTRNGCGARGGCGAWSLLRLRALAGRLLCLLRLQDFVATCYHRTSTPHCV